MKVICCKNFNFIKSELHLVWTYRVTLNSLFYEDIYIYNYLSYTDVEKERILTLLISIEAF